MDSRRLFRRQPRAAKSSPTSETTSTPKTGSNNANRTLGLRKCAEPQGTSTAVDIVFVHGLTGDRESTWKHRSTGCFWPEELLPTDLPDARIFTYGYDADVAHFFSAVSQSRIGNHAQTLLGSLAQVRERTETSCRPLLFVAHSLGGLVVEDMLLSAKNSAEDHYRQVLESTKGISFMGTPHCGSQLADWARVFTSVAKLVKRLNEPLITVLQPESEVLARIQQEFHTMIRARNEAGRPKMRMVCFFEDLDTPGVGAVVPKHSAILPAYNSFSIPADHSGMTKFQDAQDQGYLRVSNELWIWIRDLGKLQQSTVPMSDSDPTASSHKQPQLLLESDGVGQSPGNYYQGSMHNVGQVFQNSTFGTFQMGRS